MFEEILEGAHGDSQPLSLSSPRPIGVHRNPSGEIVVRQGQSNIVVPIAQAECLIEDIRREMNGR